MTVRAHVVAAIIVTCLLVAGVFTATHLPSSASTASTTFAQTAPAAPTTSQAAPAPAHTATRSTMHASTLHDIWVMHAKQNCGYDPTSWNWWQKNKPSNHTSSVYAATCPGKSYETLTALFDRTPAPATTHPAHANVPVSSDTLIYKGVNCLDPNLISAHNPCMFHDRGPQPIDPNYDGECLLAKHMARDTHLSLQQYFRKNYPDAVGNCV